MSAQHRHDDLIEAARRFAQLFNDPQPGLSTWHSMGESLYQKLRDEVLHEEEVRRLNNHPAALPRIFGEETP